MPAWWDSLETMTVISGHAKTVVFVLGLITALCGTAIFVAGKRVENLKKERDAADQAKAAKTAEEAAERTGKLELALTEQQTMTRESQSKLQDLQRTIPRTITPEQHTALVTELHPFKGQGILVAQPRLERLPYEEIVNFVEQLKNVLREAEWRIGEGMWGRPDLERWGLDNLPSGITPLYFGSEKPPNALTLLSKDLQALGQVNPAKRGDPKRDEEMKEWGGVMIFIGKKP